MRETNPQPSPRRTAASYPAARNCGLRIPAASSSPAGGGGVGVVLQRHSCYKRGCLLLKQARGI